MKAEITRVVKMELVEEDLSLLEDVCQYALSFLKYGEIGARTVAVESFVKKLKQIAEAH